MKGGDGDLCPQDPTHGSMYVMPATRHQLCPHSEHKGNPVYEYDGKTPVRWYSTEANVSPLSQPR